MAAAYITQTQEIPYRGRTLTLENRSPVFLTPEERETARQAAKERLRGIFSQSPSLSHSGSGPKPAGRKTIP